MDLESARGSGQESVWYIYNLCGVDLDPHKRQAMGVQRVFLGVQLDLSRAVTDSTLFVDLKPGLREGLLREIEFVLECKHLPPAAAAKLRGKLVWASAGMFGKCGRIGQHALICKQYHDQTDQVSPHLENALRYLHAMLQCVPPRCIHLSSSFEPCVIVYTDASFEPEKHVPPRIGFIAMPQLEGQVQAGSAKISNHTLQKLNKRKQQIAALEALAILNATLHCLPQLRNRSIIWFCDNQAVVYALIKGTSSSSDLSHIVALIHLLWTAFNIKVWVEYVDSDSNPSDGLSREGVSDAWTAQQEWHARNVREVPWSQCSETSLLVSFHFLLRWASENIGDLKLEPGLGFALAPCFLADSNVTDLGAQTIMHH